MAQIETFSATTKTFQLTEKEAAELKAHLLEVRKHYIVCLRKLETKEQLDKLEHDIIEIEHKLAHAEIVVDDQPERGMPDVPGAIRNELKHWFSVFRKKSAKSLHSPWHA